MRRWRATRASCSPSAPSAACSGSASPRSGRIPSIGSSRRPGAARAAALLAHRAGEGLAVGLGATLGAAPATLGCFGSFVPAAPVAGVVLALPVTAAIAAAFATAIFPAAAPLLTASGALLDRLVAILAATPGAALEGARQGGAGPLFLAAGALVCALRFNGPRLRRGGDAWPSCSRSTSRPRS
ncbi:MAG: ComEC/Rec2 family competence protein [Planctomycetota bacterium]